ncbi:MAG: restriction endonuclease subunit S [Rhodoferax sp.]|nr:restriction endonuclease subunit S [Rhodoferax sp.]
MLLSHLNLLATAPGGVKRLRELILTLAVQGKLVPQDPRELPAEASRIPRGIERLIEEGKVPRSRIFDASEFDEVIDSPPNGWVSIAASNIFVPRSGNSKLIKGKLFSEPKDHLFPGYSASGQDVWLSDFEYEGTAVILSAVGARCGKAFLAKGKWSAIANTHIIWPVLDVVLPEYAMLLLNNESYWIRSGGAQPFVKVTETLQQAVYLPPLAEQSRIVTRVEELMRLCDALEAKGQLEARQHAQLVSTLLATLTDSETPEQLTENWHRIAAHFDLLLDRPEAVDTLEQTILQLAVRGLLVPQDPQDEPASELLKKIRLEKDKLIAEGKIKRDKPLPPVSVDEQPFALPPGWEWVQMGDAVNSSEAGWSPTCIGSPRRSGHWGVLKVSAVSWGAFDANANKELPEDLAPRPEYEVQDGDFLLSRANTEQLVARSVVVSTAEPKLMLSDKIIRLDVSSLMNRDFLNLCNNANHARAHYIANASGTSSSMKNVSREVVLRTPVPLPPLAEQSRIVTRVAQLRRLCAELRQRLAASQSTQAHLAEALVQGV